MRATAVCAVIMLMLVSGCGAGGDQAGAPEPAAAPVRDCGSYQRSSPVGPGIPAAALRCFTEAPATKQPARLRFTAPTVEGAPIHTSFRTLADGRAEVLTDMRQDPFAGPHNRRVQREVCTGPQPARGDLMFADCSPAVPVG